MCWQRRLVWKGSPEPVKGVLIESVGFIDITVLPEVWRALEESHLQRAVDVAAESGIGQSNHFLTQSSKEPPPPGAALYL